MEILKKDSILFVRNGKIRINGKTESGDIRCTYFFKEKDGMYKETCEFTYSLHTLELISKDYDGEDHHYTYADQDEVPAPKRFVSFGMYWQEYGYQTIELPSHIDPDDRDAVIEYIRSVWDNIPLPEGSYVSGSDELDPESEIRVVRF